MNTTNKDPKKGDKLSKIKNLVGDTAITAAIKTGFLADPDIKGLDIHVTTVNGIVTLTGVVPTVEMKEKAISKASDTDGVEDVLSKIRVRVSQ